MLDDGTGEVDIVRHKKPTFGRRRRAELSSTDNDNDMEGEDMEDSEEYYDDEDEGEDYRPSFFGFTAGKWSS